VYYRKVIFGAQGWQTIVSAKIQYLLGSLNDYFFNRCFGIEIKEFLGAATIIESKE